VPCGSRFNSSFLHPLLCLHRTDVYLHWPSPLRISAQATLAAVGPDVSSWSARVNQKSPSRWNIPKRFRDNITVTISLYSLSEGLWGQIWGRQPLFRKDLGGADFVQLPPCESAFPNVRMLDEDEDVNVCFLAFKESLDQLVTSRDSKQPSCLHRRSVSPNSPPSSWN